MNANAHRILIVEDEAIVAMDITRRLERLGYAVIGTVSTGEDALRLLSAETPDLVLMDIRLAGEMDGIEAASVIRQQFDLPVIFVTAHTDTGTLERARLAEPYGYIVKPIETVQLSTTITMALYKHQMETQVRASEAKFRRLAEVNPALIVIVRPAATSGEYQVLYTNPAVNNLVAPHKVPTLLTAEAVMRHLPGEQYAALGAALDQTYSGAAPKAEVELEVTGPDGGMWWLSITLIPISYEDGPAVMLAGIDLTRQRDAERERIELAVERERRRFLQTMMDDFSHDFRNPLAAIRASVYLMKHLSDPVKIAQYQNIVESQVAHMQDMVEDFMHMSRLESDPTLELEPISIAELLYEVVNSQAGAASDKRQELCMLDIPSATQILGDNTLLFRALSNVISNAVRYTPSGGQITVSARQCGDRVEIEVADTGIGIAENDLPHIFDRFYRGSEAKVFAGGGTGLGLAIAKKIIDMHHGSISVSSVPGQGSLFRIGFSVFLGDDHVKGLMRVEEAAVMETTCPTR